MGIEPCIDENVEDGDFYVEDNEDQWKNAKKSKYKTALLRQWIKDDPRKTAILKNT